MKKSHTAKVLVSILWFCWSATKHWGPEGCKEKRCWILSIVELLNAFDQSVRMCVNIWCFHVISIRNHTFANLFPLSLHLPVQRLHPLKPQAFSFPCKRVWLMWDITWVMTDNTIKGTLDCAMVSFQPLLLTPPVQSGASTSQPSLTALIITYLIAAYYSSKTLKCCSSSGQTAKEKKKKKTLARLRS